MTRILGIAGSLRVGSYNRQLLQAAGAMVPADVRLTLFDALAAVPPYDEDADVEPPPEAVRHLRRAIAAADGLLIATPEYNGSVPGQLKNALDWASRPFPRNALRRKPTAVVGASTGLFGAVWAQAELRKALATSGANVVDAELPVAQAHGAFSADGTLADPELAAALDAVLAALLDAAQPSRRTARPHRESLTPPVRSRAGGADDRWRC